MSESDHFKGKDALTHLAEKQAQGILYSKEIHGLEMPGHLQAALDAARDTALFLLLLFSLLIHLDLPFHTLAKTISFLGLGCVLWKGGRAAWLGWTRLERLHRILAQEKWEIEHNRPQEREELVALYQAKGFEGRLLQDVVDVLMADEERLLKVMIEEEMGLSLENVEHPLKQGLGAILGSSFACVLAILALYIHPKWGLVVSELALIGTASAWGAYQADSRPLHAFVWSVSMAILAWSGTYFLAYYL